MEIREVVAGVIVQIFEGIRDAQVATEMKGAVNPRLMGGSRHELAKQGVLMATDEGWVRTVEFDIAVSVGEAENSKGGLGLVVGPWAVGATGGAEAHTATVSRVKFVVPVVYPQV